MMNIVPRTGGNTHVGQRVRQLGQRRTAGQQLHRRTEAAGLAAPNPLIKLYDFNGAVGGPIKKDKLWFFGTVRSQGNSSYIPIYYNQNAGRSRTRGSTSPISLTQAFNDKTWLNESAPPHACSSARATSSTCSGTSRTSAASRCDLRKRRQLRERAVLA